MRAETLHVCEIALSLGLFVVWALLSPVDSNSQSETSTIESEDRADAALLSTRLDIRQESGEKRSDMRVTRRADRRRSD